MSTTVDQRVVEMRFDNKNFESNVSTTMSTLAKLKERLNLTGASKGLEDINAAAKKVDMSGLGGAVEAVTAKFSALEIMGITALVNITNKAINAGETLVKSLSVDQISAGWAKFSDKTTSVATLVAQGNAIEDVNEQLDRLNWFTDETSYNFTDMVSNIAKFTATGKGLEDSVTAMEGIANWAALSGQNAATASRAMYQISQAMGAGVMRLEDYKSIQNASMDTDEFRQKCLDAAVALGTLQDNLDGTYESLVGGGDAFNKSQFTTQLTEGAWLTSDVMMKVFNDYSAAVSAIYEVTEEKGMLASEVIDEIHTKADELKTDAMSDEEAINAAIKELGYTLEDGSLMFDSFGIKAFESAQKARTWADVVDSVQDAVSTGWMNTFELIFGNAEEATELFTSLANTLYDVFASGGEKRNELLESALGKTFTGLVDKVKGIVEPLNTVNEGIKSAVETVKDYANIVDEILGGSWGNGQERWDKLTEAGYDWAHAQNLVNEKLGNAKRHATEYKEVQNEVVESTKDVSESTADYIVDLTKLSDAQLKDKQYTDEQIKALRDLEEASRKTGIPLKELIENIDEIDGRYLLINGFKNLGNSLLTVLYSIKDAYSEIFPPMTAERLFDILAGFHKLTTYLVINDETAEKITRTFKGLFAALDIVLTLTAGPLKIAFKALSSLLGAFDLNILDLTATVGDAIVSFRDWVDEVVDFDAVFEFLAPYIKNAAKAVKLWVNENIHLAEWLEKVNQYLGSAKDTIAEWIDGLKNADDVQQYIVDTIIGALQSAKDAVVNGFKNLGKTMVGSMDNVIELMLMEWSAVPSNIFAGFEKGFLFGIASIIKNVKSFCKKFITTFCDVFDIHSPSRVMIEIGKFVVAGFIIGILAMDNPISNAIKKVFTRAKDTIGGVDFSSPLDAIIAGIKTFGSKIAEVFNGIDFGKIFAAALGVGMLVVAKKALDTLMMFAKPLEGLGDFLSGIGSAFEGLGKNLKASAMKKKATAVLIIAAAVLILVKAIMPLTELNLTQLGIASLGLVVISAILVGLTYAFSKLDKFKINIGSIAKIAVIAAALFGLGYVLKTLSSIASDTANADKTIEMLGSIILGLGAIMISFGLFVSGDKAGNMDKAGTMLLKMASALLIMTQVIKSVSEFTYTDIRKGLTFVGGVGILFALVVTVSKFAGEHADKAGKMLLKMSIAMLIMAGVVKIVSGFSYEDISKGLKFVAGVELLCAGLIAMSHLSGENAKKAGSMVISVGIAMLTMAAVVKIVSGMSEEDIKKGIGAIAAFSVLIGVIIGISHFSGEHAAKAGALLISMSLALSLMVGITWIVSKLDAKEMWKAYGFVAAIVATFGALIVITKYSKATDNLKTTLILFIVAISLMVAAVVGLSFIDKKSLATATGALLGVMGMFAILMVATKYTKNTKHMRKSLVALLGVTIVLALVIAGLSKLNPNSALKSAEALSLLLLAFSASIKILNKVSINKTAIESVYDMIVIAGALGILLAAMSFIPASNIPSLLASSVALGILLNAFAASIKILNKVSINKTAIDAVYSMVAVSMTLGLLLAAMSFIPASNIPSLLASSVALGILLNAFSASIKILNKVSINKTAIDAVYSMVAVSMALGILLAAMSFIPASNIPSLLASSVALGILLNAFASSIVILGYVGPNVNKALPALQPMMLVMAELAIILGLMSTLNVEASIPSAIGLGILINALAASVVILSNAKGYISNDTLAAAVIMGLVVMELALAMGIMAAMNVESAIPYAISLGILLVAMTAAIALLGAMSGFITAAIPTVVSLGVVIAELAILLAAIGGLAQIPGLEWLISEGGDFLQVIGTAIGQFIGGIVGGIAAGAAAALPIIGVSLSAFMVAIQGFIAGAKNIDSSVLAGVGYLSAAILALAVAEFVTGIVTLGGLSLIALGLQLSGFITAAMPFIEGIKMVDPTAIEAAKNLAEMLLILTAAELINSIGSFISKFIGGGASFSDLGKQLSEFADAVCEFSNKLTENGGINATAIEAAATAGKMLVELNNSLPRSGGWVQDIIGEKDFGQFADACKAFIECMISLNEAVSQEGFTVQSEKIQQLVDAGSAFNDLNQALPRTGGIAQDLAGEKDLAGFGAACLAFVNCMIDINEAISVEGFVIQSEKLAQLATAGTKFNELNTALPRTGGIAQDLAGEKDLAGFGASVVAFADCMILVNTAVSQEGFAVNLDAIEALKQAGLKMNELQNALPKTGGWWEKIAGKQDISDFGSKIKSFGEAIASFAATSAEIDQSAINTSISTAYRIKSLISSLVGLDTSGLAEFTGIGTGGIGADGAAYKIAQAIATYSNKVADIDTNAVSVSVSTAQKLKSLITGLVGLDTSGIENFKPGTIGSQMKNYSEKVAGIDTNAVSVSVSAAQKLKTLIASLVDLDTTGVTSFGNIRSIASSLQSYSVKVAEINGEQISSSVSNAQKLISLIKSMTGIDTSGVSSFISAVNSLSKVNLSELSNAFKDTSGFTSVGSGLVDSIVKGINAKQASMSTAGSTLITKLTSGINSKRSTATNATVQLIKAILKTFSDKYSTFKTTGETLMNKVIEGINSKKSAVKTACASPLSDAISTMGNYKSSFYSLGKSMVEGLANGISENSYIASAKAAAMASAAYQSAKETLKVNSPSKIFRSLGYSVVEGFTMGIDRLAGDAASSAVNMTNTAINTASNAITQIAEAINTDMDTQPTIRPVVDLSNVQSGAAAISGLFNTGASVGVAANVGAISTMMNNRQNGSNDIVSAINKLHKDMSNMGNTYYTVDGINYNEGSDIAGALQTITRTAIRERRV